MSNTPDNEELTYGFDPASPDGDYASLIIKTESGLYTYVDAEAEAIMELIHQHDNQLRTKLLEALPEKQDEHPIDPETGTAVEVYGYEATYNQAIDACKQAISAVLGETDDRF
jgi:hypothetical protein